MRNFWPWMNDYIATVYPSLELADAKVKRRVFLADLCLHFLCKHLQSDEVAVMPILLQGHCAVWLREDLRAPLFRLRQYAHGLAARFSWNGALEEHARHAPHTAYLVAGGVIRPSSHASSAAFALLDRIIATPAPYSTREFFYGKEGKAYIRRRNSQDRIQIMLPAPTARGAAFDLTRRQNNPAIAVPWSLLLHTAAEADARENAPGFPAWLPKLHLEDRLKRVSITDLGEGFFRDGVIYLDRLHHVVGMLSSGKSTLLQALLFLLISPAFNKRVLVLSKDTASASELIARVKAHGYDKATVISSLNRRDEHLNAALWNSAGFPTEQSMEAAAGLTETLDTACPLEGYQENDHSFADKLKYPPCDILFQPNTRKDGTPLQDKNVTCPYLTVCPTHRQQRQLGSAHVVAMTPQAFLLMTPQKYALLESLSFPEAAQFLTDVVLIDEADEIQRAFDKECTQNQALLTSSGTAFTRTSSEALAISINTKGGAQYGKRTNLLWHRQYNVLQDAIAAIYHLLISRSTPLNWVVDSRTFTASSILSKLLPVSADRPGAVKKLEQLAALNGVVYSTVVDLDLPTPAEKEALLRACSNDVELINAFRFLLDLQPTVLEEVVTDGMRENAKGLQAKLIEAIEKGPLQVFAGTASPAKKTRRHPLSRSTRPPSDAASRAYAITLALLTNACLASFNYLVHNIGGVEDDFDLSDTAVFRQASNIIRQYSGLVPSPLTGFMFGLLFEPSTSDAESGGSLSLTNHLTIGRYLLTNLHRLLQAEDQAGPHVLLLSGTSWAGGSAATASPLFDVQWPVCAILEQPQQEREALAKSRCEYTALGPTPIRVSGLSTDERQDNLRKIATQMMRKQAAGTVLQAKWQELAATDHDGSAHYELRRRALLVVNNYQDARIVAETIARLSDGHHTAYCLVSDAEAKKASTGMSGASPLAVPRLHFLPRSRVETFGQAPDGSILVAPLQPISRGHNIVLPGRGIAAISTIYFLHRPHPRPDNLDVVIGALNRFAMEVLQDRCRPPEGASVDEAARWFRKEAQRALDDGFALRTAYGLMSDHTREQFAWDLITSLWQTVGRGIRGGVPVFVAFVDERFSPGVYRQPPETDTKESSCIVQSHTTLATAMSAHPHPSERAIAERLYQPFQSMLHTILP